MKIIIQPYTEKWVNDFTEEKSKLEETLKGMHAVVEHIGSTSVPGLGAKPIIDILIGLQSGNDLDKVITPMQQSGYTYFRKYEPMMPYRRLFIKLEPLPHKMPPAIVDIGEEFVTGKDFRAMANIHILVKDTPHWDRHIAFRDFLRAHPDTRDAYYALKKELSVKEFRDTLEYNQAKDAFVKEVEQRALNWYYNPYTSGYRNDNVSIS
ncbi:MAG TPA: GrpB family protein [Chitinophaga sp.]